jgi:hypothetical protein
MPNPEGAAEHYVPPETSLPDFESEIERQAYMVSEDAGRIVDGLYFRAVSGRLDADEIGMAAARLRKQVFEAISRIHRE